MTLNSSGPISLGGSTVGQSVNLELGNSATTQISLNDTAVRNLAGISSGAISLNDLYGTSVDPYGTFTATYSSNASDTYSGGAILSSLSCGGNSYSSFDARPPSQSQLNSIISTWLNCRLYSTQTPALSVYHQGLIWGRSGSSLSLTFSGWPANVDMATYLYTNSSRVITASGMHSGTFNSTIGYAYWTMSSTGSGTVTYSFGSSADPPYVYWVGRRYAP